MKIVKYLPQTNWIYQDNALSFLSSLPDESINMAITSPPYWGLRDYGVEPQIWGGDEKCKHLWGKRKKTLTHKSGESNPGKEGWYKDKGASDDSGSEFCIKCNAWRGSLGLEPTFNLYLKHLGDIFDEIKRVLKKEGTCWVNMGDTFGGSGAGTGSNINNSKETYQLPKGKARASKLRGTNYQKCLLQIPSRFAIEMTNRGWILRNEIIWHKPNAMPSSVKDRFTVDYEKLFFFTKSKKYYFETQYEPYTEPMNRWAARSWKQKAKAVGIKVQASKPIETGICAPVVRGEINAVFGRSIPVRLKKLTLPPTPKNLLKLR